MISPVRNIRHTYELRRPEDRRLRIYPANELSCGTTAFCHSRASDEKRMKFQPSHVFLVVVIWSCCSGCVTKRLWEEKEFNEPSPQPNLQLYYSDQKRDVLVTYDELRESSSSVYRRGYYLNEFAKTRAKHPKPTFVDSRETNNLQQIPVVTKIDTTRPTTNSYAVLHDDGQFSVTLNGARTGPFELPVYQSGFQQAAQIALTPAAVVADTVIVASVVGAIVAYSYARGNTH